MNTSNNVICRRFHLAELEDQAWCPSWLREHTHRALRRAWSVSSGDKGSIALQAARVLVAQLGGLARTSKFTFVDACAGAGGPTPLIEEHVNDQLRESELAPVEFILTDLWPDVNAWRKIMAASEHITCIEQPIDATKGAKVVPTTRKECRMFNLCFHHFDDSAAEQVLHAAIDSCDAFIIFEITHRTLPALLNTTLIILSPFLTTLYDWWWSPLHLFFTYVIPVVPVFYMIDGYVSCLRGRTSEETWHLLTRRSGLSVSAWEAEHGWSLRSGSQLVLPPFGTLYWYCGVKKAEV